MRLFILGWLLLLSTASMAAETLRIAIDVPYPPFTFRNEQGVLTGFDIDITNALCTEIKRECVFVEMPFDKILAAIVAGDADISIAGIGDTPERRALVDFTGRYFRSNSVFIEKPGTVTGVTPAELKGKRIGVQASTMQEKHVRDVYQDSICVAQEHVETIFEDLRQGRTDVLLIDGLPGYEYLKSPAGEGLETVGPPIREGVLVSDAAIAVAKRLPEVRQALDEAIQSIRRNGEYARINRKYFDFNVY